MKTMKKVTIYYKLINFLMNFLQKLTAENIKKTILNKGYTYYETGNFNLNIIGVRKKNNIPNKYDDYITVTYKDVTGYQKFKVYPATTEPGLHWLLNLLNPNGTAILVPGQYKGCWQIGLHQGKYEALCQAKPVKTYRDKNKNQVLDYDPKTITEGIYGINIHSTSPTAVSLLVNKYSAGCQVFQNWKDFQEFMEICKQARKIYGNSFTYTLITEEDIDKVL